MKPDSPPFESMSLFKGGWRLWVLMLALLTLFALLAGRLVYLHLFESSFLTNENARRTLRQQVIPAHRGKILDRNGEPLAISTPVASIWINPSLYWKAPTDIEPLCAALSLDCSTQKQRLANHRQREFLYLKRQLPPIAAEKVIELDIPGVALQYEYKRFYPAAEVTAQLVGFTDIEDHGLEGIELAYDKALTGRPGTRRVMQDRLGRVVKVLGVEKEAEPGADIHLTLDLNLQYLAYRAVKSAVQTFQAESGALVLADVRTGDVLALVNQPSYNPNNQQERRGSALRNRAFTDVFEPGSTMKAFTIATALDSGKYHPNSRIDTSPGYMNFGDYRIRDHRNYGVIDLTTLITKSSNIGSSKIALDLGGELLWSTFQRLGLGMGTGSGFPGEVSGWLPDPVGMRPSEIATLSYGYGLAITPVQLAQAYLALASGGVVRPIKIVVDQASLPEEVVFTKSTTAHVRKMLNQVVTESGTGARARVPGYEVAGKTGTSRIVGKQGYDSTRHVSYFAGMAPAENPAFVMVVVIRDPKSEAYSGGKVAAPVFSKVMQVALRNASIPPSTESVSQLSK